MFPCEYRLPSSQLLSPSQRCPSRAPRRTGEAVCSASRKSGSQRAQPKRLLQDVASTTSARRSTKRVAASSRRSNGSSRRGRSLRGIASYYWQPQRVASGGWFNPNALTAAHKTLRFGTRVRVTNLRNGRSVVVRINDRGPYIKGRIIDLSRRAATIVGMRGSGVAPVRVDIL